MSVFGNTSRLARIKEYWKGGTTKGESHVQDIKWLIGQAQLVEDLTKKRKSDAARNALVEEENARLREALEFYADQDNHRLWEKAEDANLTEFINAIDMDSGDIAKSALNWAKNE